LVYPILIHNNYSLVVLSMQARVTIAIKGNIPKLFCKYGQMVFIHICKAFSKDILKICYVDTPLDKAILFKGMI